MKQLSILLVGLALVSCSSSLPPESFRQANTASSSTIAEEEVLEVETPATTESLEVRNQDVRPIPVHTTAKNSIVLGDAGSGTVRGKNPPTMQIVMDYACEFCREEALSIRPWIRRTYVHDHRMNLEILFSPQSAEGTLHAKAAVCSAKLGFYEAMDAYLLLHPGADFGAIVTFAEKKKVKSSSWKFCMDTTTFEPVLDPKEKVIELLPAFMLGSIHWIGIESDSVIQERIDKYLESR